MSLTRHVGWYVDTCWEMILEDMQHQGLSLGDFRVTFFHYDLNLNTVPRDTSGKFFSFDFLYKVTKYKEDEMRAAAYLINFDRKLIRAYDVNMGDEKAQKQVEDLMKGLTDLKEGLNIAGFYSKKT